MQISNDCRSSFQADGVVRRVDPVSREVEVRVAGAPVNFYVRPDCVILLRGERVKLRLIQPRDRVRVAYTEGQAGHVADAIEIRPGAPAALL
jgi:hypothetical protein